MQQPFKMTHNLFVYKLFDKRDAFPFSIVRMPYVSSNIPESIFYSAMVGEFLRIARSTLLLADFLPKARELIHRLKNQGAVQHTSTRHLRRIIQRHPDDSELKQKKCFPKFLIDIT